MQRSRRLLINEHLRLPVSSSGPGEGVGIWDRFPNSCFSSPVSDPLFPVKVSFLVQGVFVENDTQVCWAGWDHVYVCGLGLHITKREMTRSEEQSECRTQDRGGQR